MRLSEVIARVRRHFPYEEAALMAVFALCVAGVVLVVGHQEAGLEAGSAPLPGEAASHRGDAGPLPPDRHLHIVTRDYAQKAALATDPDARVSGVHLGHKAGRRVWQVLLTEDGSVRDVDVDAGSGTILQTKGRLRDAH